MVVFDEAGDALNAREFCAAIRKPKFIKDVNPLVRMLSEATTMLITPMAAITPGRPVAPADEYEIGSTGIGIIGGQGGWISGGCDMRKGFYRGGF